MKNTETLGDLEIAQRVKLRHISNIAEKAGLDSKDIEMYGNYKAKIPLGKIDKEKIKQSNLILVSAISPTPGGEGKTTVSIGLSEALNRLGKKTTVVLREPSLGPVFGIKVALREVAFHKCCPWKILTCTLREIFLQLKRHIIFWQRL